MLVFCFYDSKADSYTPPFCVETVGLAERFCVIRASEPGSDFQVFGEDFILCEMGEFNPKSGEMICTAPAHGVSVAQIVRMHKGDR